MGEEAEEASRQQTSRQCTARLLQAASETFLRAFVPLHYFPASHLKQRQRSSECNSMPRVSAGCRSTHLASRLHHTSSLWPSANKGVSQERRTSTRNTLTKYLRRTRFSLKMLKTGNSFQSYSARQTFLQRKLRCCRRGPKLTRTFLSVIRQFDWFDSLHDVRRQDVRSCHSCPIAPTTSKSNSPVCGGRCRSELVTSICWL